MINTIADPCWKPSTPSANAIPPKQADTEVKSPSAERTASDAFTRF